MILFFISGIIKVMKSVYIHIPFCKYICSYCDFCKKYIKGQPVDKYLEYLDLEISMYLKDRIQVDTIYIGGGTPSSMSHEQINKLMKIINKHFIFNDNYEFTFEANPDDVSDELIKIITKSSVNRLSLGVQTLNDQINHENMRMHSSDDVQNALDIASKYLTNISIDFIFNLPKQTLNDIKTTIDFIKKNDNKLKHISYYSLILEDNTILHTREFEQMSEETESDVYDYIQTNLNQLGFNQYEISNFGKQGYHSKHNQVYWDNEQYYGFGLGASGYVDNIRYTNLKAMNMYFDAIDQQIHPYMDSFKLTNYDHIQETIMLGLRTSKGIKLSVLKGIDLNMDYFEISNDYIRIKPNKLFISNEIIVELLEKFDND